MAFLDFDPREPDQNLTFLLEHDRFPKTVSTLGFRDFALRARLIRAMAGCHADQQ
jgi:hypothetical protein